MAGNAKIKRTERLIVKLPIRGSNYENVKTNKPASERALHQYMKNIGIIHEGKGSYKKGN